jgi:hypothetical protein
LDGARSRQLRSAAADRSRERSAAAKPHVSREEQSDLDGDGDGDYLFISGPDKSRTGAGGPAAATSTDRRWAALTLISDIVAGKTDFDDMLCDHCAKDLSTEFKDLDVHYRNEQSAFATELKRAPEHLSAVHPKHFATDRTAAHALAHAQHPHSQPHSHLHGAGGGAGVGVGIAARPSAALAASTGSLNDMTNAAAGGSHHLTHSTPLYSAAPVSMQMVRLTRHRRPSAASPFSD